MTSVMRPRLQLFAILAALSLLVRLLVPAGFMPHMTRGQVAIVACPGVMAGAGHAHGHDAPGHDGFERPCAFAAVAAAATIVAVAAVLALPSAPVAGVHRPLPAVLRRRSALRWRPPLRAPPAILLVR
jgi:hypothetical protein